MSELPSKKQLLIEFEPRLGADVDSRRGASLGAGVDSRRGASSRSFHRELSNL